MLLPQSPFARTRTATTLPWVGFVIAACLVLAPLQKAWAQPTEKKIGFGMSVSTDGFFSSTIAKVAVTQVSPDSQALAAGVTEGDEIVKVQDITVPGNSATKLKDHLDFVPGMPKKIRFKRSNGTEFDVVFTRALAPKTGS